MCDALSIVRCSHTCVEMPGGGGGGGGSEASVSPLLFLTPRAPPLGGKEEKTADTSD